MIILERFRGKNLAVFGLGKTGLSVINSLLNSGANVYAWDDNTQAIDLARENYQLCNFLHPDLYDWSNISALIISPGIPLSHWVINLAKQNRKEILSDIELLFSALRAKFIAITGTNGKSTTTTLVYHIMKSLGLSVDIGGNIGKPVLDMLPGMDYYLLELSSFQIDLLNLMGSNIEVGVLLNITKDHTDHHGNMENYINVKKKIINFSKVMVISYDYQITREIGESIEDNVIPISCHSIHQGKISVVGKYLYNNYDNTKYNLCDININLVCNAENIAAAYAVCYSLKLDSLLVITAIKTFNGLKHRNEYLGKIGKISFINDSKATNANSTEKALIGYDNIYWILGGKSKEGGIIELEKYFYKIKVAFLIGEATELFASTLLNKVRFIKCETLENAFFMAYNIASKDNIESVILLSPACSSFDQWRNFEERGDKFRKLFLELKANLDAIV